MEVYLSKIMGYLLMVFGCSGLGIWYSVQMQQKVFHLKEMIRILEMICSEIDYGRYTLPECFEIVSQRTIQPYDDILRKISKEDFERDWEKHLREGLKCVQAQEEREHFIECFLDVGYADERMQRKSMERGIKKLQTSVAIEEEDLKKRSKLAITLGTMCGVLLVLIML